MARHDKCEWNCGGTDCTAPTRYVPSKEVEKEMLGESDSKKSGVEGRVMCAGCFKADTLLKMALASARGRLIDVTNETHDKTFDMIAEYLEGKYPNKGGCPSFRLST